MTRIEFNNLYLFSMNKWYKARTSEIETKKYKNESPNTVYRNGTSISDPFSAFKIFFKIIDWSIFWKIHSINFLAIISPSEKSLYFFLSFLF